MSISISLVSPQQRPVALRLLFARFPVDEQPSRLADTLRAADQGALNLDGLLLAEENGLPVGAALSLHQRDGISLIWPPVVSCQTDEVAAKDALMTRLCDEVTRSGSRLAQALLDPEDSVEVELLQRFEFAHSTDLFFLARALTPEDTQVAAAEAPAKDDLDHLLYCPETSDRFASVIQRTYQGSLDCPFLDGFRSGREAIVSHRLSGRFDPAGWRLYQLDGQDVGVVMMNEHPDQDAIELVYFGIVPEFRGRGLGRRLLADGLQAAAMTDRAAMFLAVDCGNSYANALYEQSGFNPLARRKVMLRRFDQMACK